MNDQVPDWLRKSAAIAWRLLVVGAVLYFLFRTLTGVSVVVLSAIIALFPASLLWGPTQWLKSRGWNPILATWTVVLGALAIVVGIGFLVIPALIDGLGPLVDNVQEAYGQFLDWLTTGPLGLSEADVERYTDQILGQLGEQASLLATGVLSGAAVAVNLLTGIALAFIVTFFILKDGDRIADGIAHRLPPVKAERFRRAGRVAWRTLSKYVQGLAIVGLADAIAIGIGLAILGIDLVVPLMILVFLGAFFPIIGAFASGLFAVAVALVDGGLTDALIVFGIVIAVQQMEGNLLHPIVFGRALSLHPLVILLAIAVGGIAFGIIGAFLAVPIAAVAVAVGTELSSEPDKSYVTLASSLD